MDDDEKGKRFLELIDEQNNLQWSTIVKISALINSNWNSIDLHRLVDRDARNDRWSHRGLPEQRRRPEIPSRRSLQAS